MRVITATLITFLASAVQAGELIQNFNSPAFSGNGYSTHVLTVHQLEQNRSDKINDDAQAAEDRAERELKSTNLYKFQNNLESRIYAQLSKQIADSLFGEGGDVVEGNWAVSETPFGDTIQWKREDGIIHVEIYDSNGDLASEFQTPVGDFAF